VLKSRSAFLIAALSTALLLSLPILRPYDSLRRWYVDGGRRELRALVEALASEPMRPIEGRLAGGFVYAPVRPESRGPSGPDVSPEIRIAAAKLDKLARDNDTPQYSAARGAAQLILGDWDEAVASLEDAVEREGANASFQNDLAVAYLARASGSHRPQDWISALGVANRAIAVDPLRPEPYFNRALVLRGLHLTTEEALAWNTYLSVDASSRWAHEAHERLVDATARQRRNRLVDGGMSDDHQALRERIEDSLLRQWGAAEERGDMSAASLLDQAARSAEALAADGGDALAHDEIARIRRAQRRGDRRALIDLAVGHRLYGESREALLREDLLGASTLMSRAVPHLLRAQSQYAQWGPIVQAIFLRNKGLASEAIEQLHTVPLTAIPGRYFHLRGRRAWIEALPQGALGRLDVSRSLLASAVAAFEEAGENENLIATQTILAEAEWFLGDRAQAWTNLRSVLSNTDRRPTTRRTAHFHLAATMALGAGLPEAAINFQDILIRTANTPRTRVEAYVNRARTLVRLGRRIEASQDLEQASKALSTLSDPALRERNTVDVEMSQAEMLTPSDCLRAMQHSDRALRYLEHYAGAYRRAGVLAVRAKCRQAGGDLAGARADLLGAVTAFEQRRASVVSATDRIHAFELERAAFKDLLSLEGVVLDDERAALETAERERSGVLAEAWGLSNGLDIDHRRLPVDVAVVYYETLPDRVLTWVLTQERRAFLSRRLAASELSRMTSRIQRVIRQGGDLTAVRPHSAPLVDALVGPALAEADRGVPGPQTKTTVVFIPDGPLFGLPFGALPDAEGRALLATRTVAIAPSLRTLFAASARLGTFTPSTVLAIGDGHDPSTTALPKLPRADSEAAAVGRLYPHGIVLTGAEATKRRFLQTPADIIHFAGHSVMNESYPMYSRMLFAPEPATGDSGWLLGTEIAPDRFSATAVVMLATCEGAAGRPVEGEGAVSLARAFFAAGVPAVVASLWPVDDDLQTLFQAFHQTLRVDRDPARALRAGQLALLSERGANTPIRVWGGFIMLGGLASVH
jgi:CHAT domain-containing protein/tetratricopeptide (TPR) repeat protein